jgi:hypothetical protein
MQARLAFAGVKKWAAISFQHLLEPRSVTCGHVLRRHTGNGHGFPFHASKAVFNLKGPINLGKRPVLPPGGDSLCR